MNVTAESQRLPLKLGEENPPTVCKDFNAELVEMNGERDHVHLQVNYPPNVSVLKLVNNLKGVSSRILAKAIAGSARKMLWILSVGHYPRGNARKS